MNRTAKKLEFHKKSWIEEDTIIRYFSYICIIILLFVPLFFIYLNTVQPYYFIDEKFHIPQTLQYCKGNFFEWDSKITTLPGLYLFAALIFGSIKLCTITYLRFINVICTFINVYLIYQIFERQNINNKFTKRNSISYFSFLRSWNIAFFPPLFFWFFLFYTDIFSVTLILLMILCHMYNKNKTAAIVGILSVCVRQTNIIWVAYIGIERGLITIDEITKKPHLTDTINLLPCIMTVYSIFKAKANQGFKNFLQYLKLVCSQFIPYLFVLILFVIFVIYNNGIVVGDRSAHKPTIHLTQLFYYSIFVLGFSWPYLLTYFIQIIKIRFIYLHHLILLSFMTCICLIIIHFNTLVHPYILADNRHYSFYVWNYFMNRYNFFKYILTPVYVYAIWAVLKSLNHLKVLHIISYVLCVCIVLTPQLLLEPRYFIIPYILYRLKLKKPQNWQLIAETITTIVINIAQFTLFVNKTFHWSDEEHPQRIAW